MFAKTTVIKHQPQYKLRLTTILQVKLTAVQHSKERGTTSDGDRYLKFDEAASDLGNRFGGSFFGRIQDVATAPQELLTAVNAVLCSSMNLPSRSELWQDSDLNERSCCF